jgi:hypothetical protein
MAVQSATSSISYTGNNSTVTTYAVPFYFLENAHLAAIAKVTATGVETAITLTNHTGAGDINGGTVRTSVAVPATSTLNIFRTVPATQTTQYQEGGDFPAASHERALDKLTFISQQNARAVQRSLRVTEGSGEKNEVVAVPNTLIGLDSSNQPKALTLSEVKTYLALSGVTLDVNAGMKTFADAGERALAVPDFTGQLGTQRDTADIYISTGTSAGHWSLVDENMSLADFASGFFTADATGRGKFASSFVDAGLIASDAVTTAKILNANVTSAKLAYDGGPMSGFRNRIINGNFDIWQRGTSFSTQGYTSDRWQLFITGTTCTLSRQAFTLGQTEVPLEPTYFNRAAVTSSAGASNLCLVSQRIEDVRTLAGQDATVSFYAKADAAKPIALELTHFFGSGGSPSATVATIGSQKFNLTTSWQKFTATISIPSISGKTLGSDNNSRLQINLWLDAGSGLNANTDSLGQQSGTFDIAQVQVEQGSVATPFEARPIGVERSLCERYYEISNGNLSFFTGNVTNGELYSAQVGFAVTKRALPTVTLTNSANQNFSSSVGANVVGSKGFYETRTANGTGRGGFVSTWLADAEL